jgi:hypothetical protein
MSTAPAYKRWVVEHSGMINFLPVARPMPPHYLPADSLNQRRRASGFRALNHQELKDHISKMWAAWAAYNPLVELRPTKQGPVNQGNW